jgi:ADP-heptose:LPS heptosyltransferase
MKILVLRGGALGDFLLTLPAVAGLREKWPDAEIEIVTARKYGELVVGPGAVHAVRPMDQPGLASFYAKGGNLDPEWADYFTEFDFTISYLFDPDEIFRTNVGRVTRAQVVQAPHRPYETSPMSASAQLLVPLERLGIFDPDPVPRLPLRPGAPRTPRRLGLHPGSGGISKNWSRSNWRTLVERLVGETDLEFLLVGGEAEVGALDELAPLVPEERRRVLRNRPLDEVATHLAGCGGFLGHDSGITHLAAAVGTPVLALWGPSVEHIWKPGGNHVQTLRPPGGLGSLEPETVLRRLGEILPR